MSGGRWDYIQHRLEYVIEDITNLINNNGKKKDVSDLEKWEIDWIKKYPEDAYHYKHTDEVIKRFKEARLSIAEAQEHVQRLDWLLCGDDGEGSYIDRLDENMNDIRELFKITTDD